MKMRLAGQVARVR